jgi:hypothetical protein
MVCRVAGYATNRRVRHLHCRQIIAQPAQPAVGRQDDGLCRHRDNRPFTPQAIRLGFVAPRGDFFAFLALLAVTSLLLTQACKRRFHRRYAAAT